MFINFMYDAENAYGSSVSNKAAVYGILSVACIVIGLVLNWVGYRIRRVGMVASAFFAGGDYAYLVASAFLDMSTSTESQYWAIYCICGIVLGFIAALHPKSGAAITGFVAAAQVVVMLFGAANYAGSYTLPVVLATFGGLLGGGLTVLLQKPGLVAATAFVGATLMIDGVRHFVYRKIYVNNAGYSLEYLVDDIRSAWWGLCAGTLGLFVLGIGVQFVTARGVNFETQGLETAAGGHSAPSAREDAHFASIQSPLANQSANAKSSGDPIALA